MIKFPRAFMRSSELQKLGLPEELLQRAYADKNQGFAMKINPIKANSPLVFETQGLAEWLSRQIDAQVRGMER